MTVTAFVKDREALTLTVTVTLDADVDRVWQLWADARQLERWWGPPEWPAAFHEHNLRPGGRARYTMTGPDGTTASGWWSFTAVEPVTYLALDDGFTGADGEPDLSLPVSSMQVRISPAGAGSTMVLTSRLNSLEDLDRLIAMGMEEGMTAALGQIEAILAED